MGAAGPAIALQAVGTLTSAYGGYQEGLAQSDYYKYLAGNSRTEAALVRNQGQTESTLAQDAGARESNMALNRTREISGTQTAAAAENVGGGSVSSEDIARDTFDKSKLDQMAIKYNADVKSWRALNESNQKAFSLENEARGYDYSAAAAKQKGKLDAFNSLLSGSTQVAETNYKSKTLSATSTRPRTASSRIVGGGRPFQISSGNY